MILLFTFFCIHSFSVEVKKISEGILTEKYPNSIKSIILKNNLVYSVNQRSFEIYKLNKNEFINIYSLDLEGSLHSLDIFNNCAFVTTTPPINRVYKIDISNVNLPVVIDTLNIAGSYTGFIFKGKYCVSKISKDRDWAFHIFDTEGFEELSVINAPHYNWPVEKLNDKLLTVTSNNFIEIYKLQENKLILLAKSPVTDLSFPRKTFILNDSIFIHSCANGGLRVFNISNPFSWELITNIKMPISNFKIKRDNLIALNGGHKIKLYDISDISNPFLADSLFLNETTRDLDIKDDNIYITCKEGNIYSYKTTGNKFTFQSEYSHHGYFKDAIQYENNLILNTALGFTIQAQIVDNEIKILNENEENLSKRYLRNDKDNFVSYAVVKNSKASKTDINRIVPDGIKPLHKGIYNLPDNVAIFNNNLIYLNMGYVKIFNIGSSLELITELSFSETRVGRFYFYNNHIFLIGNEQGFVFGFDESNSNIHLKGKFHTYSNNSSNVTFYKDYMFISQSNGSLTCDIYDISDLTEIELFDVINYAGRLSIDPENELLFLGDYACKIYDISKIDNHKIEFLAKISNYTPIVKLFTLKENNNNFLLLVGETSVCLYSYQ